MAQSVTGKAPLVVAGFGMNSRADLRSLRAALMAAQAGGPPVTALAALRDHAARLHPLAEAMGVALIVLEPALLRGTATPSQSARSHAVYGTGSVAEACALSAAAPARLLSPRATAPDRNATCAIAERVPQ
ncbi:MAG: cobalamin biosynthesis protein [Paracoccus sp. (in: a-proteobacteria)]|nr:cobalamin biosynthesis protein [Paracoccus sp. (in: a-proteobacteria)]